MFVDHRDWPPAPRWENEPRRPALSKRQQRILLWLIGLNIVLLLIAPLAGSTLVYAVVKLIQAMAGNS